MQMYKTIYILMTFVSIEICQLLLGMEIIRKLYDGQMEEHAAFVSTPSSEHIKKQYQNLLSGIESSRLMPLL